MFVGLQAFNGAGYYQIDSTFVNLRLIAKGTMHVPPPFTAGSTFIASSASVFVNGVSPVVAFRSPMHTGIGILNTLTPSLYQVRAVAGVEGDVEYFIFDRAAPTPSSFGLQVFDGGGTLVYDSGDKSLRVLDNYMQASIGLGTETFRDYPGKKIAVIASGALRLRASGGGLNSNFLLGCRTIGDSSLGHSFTMIRREAAAPINYVSFRQAGRLVVDVTNF
jgi:hypothetical protein